VQKVSLVTEIAARLAMGLGRLEGNQAGVTFEKTRETDAVNSSREE